MADTNWVGVTPDPPNRYRLAEAKRELDKQTCANDGHDYEHTVTADGELLNIYCPRCGRSWAAVEK